ncbi:CoA transferase [Streptomyces albus]|uniref:CoA transferase n=1 Tax=Streptomyces albus TaxID=1888 RepID=UPI003D6823CC
MQSEAGLLIGDRHAGADGQGRHSRSADIAWRHVRLQFGAGGAAGAGAAPGEGSHPGRVVVRGGTVEWMGFPLYYAYDGAAPPPRAGAAHATIYPYGPFTAGDGKTVMLSVQNEREWQGFCTRFLGRPDLVGASRLPRQRAAGPATGDTLGPLIAARFRGADRDEAGGSAGPDTGGLGPRQFRARGVAAPAVGGPAALAPVGTPVGPLPALAPPGPTGAAPRMDPVPDVGEHTDAVLAELGFSAEEITGLRQEGAV